MCISDQFQGDSDVGLGTTLRTAHHLCHVLVAQLSVILSAERLFVGWLT